MRSKFFIWIKAARLRTLPLSTAGIIVGNGMAYSKDRFSILIALFSILTTIAFQVLSNFANDYGDGVKGTDNQDRIGPARVLQLGLLQRSELRKGLFWCTLICLILTLCLIFISFDSSQWKTLLIFFLLGVASIFAAIKYTVGDNAYGYYAMGDLFVFLFFGGLSVLGSFYLQTHQFDLTLIFPAVSLGCFSTAVLNLNNMRDHSNDKVSNKITIPILLGRKKANYYHAFLITLGFASSINYAYVVDLKAIGYLFLIMIVPLGVHLRKVFSISSDAALDPELKAVALSTFFFAILLTIGNHLSNL